MGAGGSTIKTRNEQEIRNQITQISEANCITTALNTSQIKIDVINSTIGGDLNIQRVQLINGISCTLRSSMDSELINNQSNDQSGTIENTDELDPISRAIDSLSKLTPWGAASDIFESLRQDTLDLASIQKVTNEVTQQINALCQNRVANENAPINVSIVDSKVKGNVNINEEQKVSNTSCIIENTTRNYVRNDQSNVQEGVIKNEKKNGMIGALMAVVFLIIIMVVVGGLMGHGIIKKK